MPTFSEFRVCLAHIRATIAPVYGFLTRRETEALAALAAFSSTPGDILEIGSLRGKSAIVLALASRLADSGPTTVAAVDPLPDVGPMATDSLGRESAEALLRANLTAAGVAEQVEIYKMLSHDLAKTWARPLRMLWIDGSHKFPAVSRDFADFSPHLVDGGVIAFHDVLHPRCDGPLRVFAEKVLKNDRFAPAGLCGTIGWARFNANRRPTPAEKRFKEKLATRLLRLLPLQQQDVRLSGIAKWRYRWRRMRIPHGPFDLAAWRGQSA
jgi:predicted O-methyltransferase YrrM